MGHELTNLFILAGSYPCSISEFTSLSMTSLFLSEILFALAQSSS